MSAGPLAVALLLAGEGVTGTDRHSFAESLAVHGGLRASNVATTRWSLAQGAWEGNGLMAHDMEVKQAGLSLVLAGADYALPPKPRRILRALHLAGTVVACVLDLRAGKRARGTK